MQKRKKKKIGSRCYYRPLVGYVKNTKHFIQIGPPLLNWPILAGVFIIIFFFETAVNTQVEFYNTDEAKMIQRLNRKIPHNENQILKRTAEFNKFQVFTKALSWMAVAQ